MVEKLSVFHKLFWFFFETGSCVAWAGLEVVLCSRMILNLVLLLPIPNCWGYRSKLSYLPFLTSTCSDIWVYEIEFLKMAVPLQKIRCFHFYYLLPLSALKLIKLKIQFLRLTMLQACVCLTKIFIPTFYGVLLGALAKNFENLSWGVKSKLFLYDSIISIKT